MEVKDTFISNDSPCSLYLGKIFNKTCSTIKPASRQERKRMQRTADNQIHQITWELQGTVLLALILTALAFLGSLLKYWKISPEYPFYLGKTMRSRSTQKKQPLPRCVICMLSLGLRLQTRKLNKAGWGSDGAGPT